MSLRLGPLAASLAALAFVAFPSGGARACGGCFHEASQTETTVVTGHRMAFSISPARTVLWDQIKYSGAPSAFAWVLPVRSGAYVEAASDAWFEALDAATSVRMVSPELVCPGSGPGCGAKAESGSDGPSYGGNIPTVTVVHQGTVGPYETVTLHADVPNALPGWLTAHGFAIDPSVQPVIDAYVNEGFDFIALRLLPDQGVQQMKPVRVVTPGMTPTLPLRMVAAGTGANVAITLFVIGEGRWEAQNFPNATIDRHAVIWDFATDSSNYATLRQVALADDGWRTWLTPYARQWTLLGDASDDSGQPTPYQVGGTCDEDGCMGGTMASSIAEAYVDQGITNGETADSSCLDALSDIAPSTEKVSGDCLGQGGAGGGGAGGTGGAGGGPACSVPAGDIDARKLACGPLDDVAAALVGMHPEDVWITRLEANLPRAALAQDLTLRAASPQEPVNNWLHVTRTANEPCSGEVTTGAMSSAAGVRHRNRVALAGSILVAVAAALGRRRRRAPRPALAPVSALR